MNLQTIASACALTTEPNYYVMMNPVEDYVINVMPHMDGWCSATKAKALAKSVVEEKPEIAVEIGVFAGRSLLAIALAQQANGKGRLIGIDPWSAVASVEGFEDDAANRDWWSRCDHDKIYNQARIALGSYQLTEQVNLIRATSQIAAPLFKLTAALLGSPYIDFLHIDGNHSEQLSTHDVLAFVPLVRPRGIVVFDDTNWNTTKKAQQLLLDFCDFLYFVESDDGQQCGFYRRKTA